MNVTLGIGTYTLTWSFGVPGYAPPANPLRGPDLIRIAERHQLRLVQFADNYPLHLKDERELEEIKARADEAGVRIELGTRGTEPQHLLQYLEICRRFGSTLLRTIITTASMDRAEAELREVLPAFKQAGVAIAVENHGMHTVRELTELFERVGEPSHLGCCLDTVNSFGALESPKEVIRALSPYILNLHIKDFDIVRVDHQMGFTVQGTPAGAGRLNVPQLLAHLRALNKRPTSILELWTPYCGSTEATVAKEREWMAESIAYLRKIGLT